MELQAQLTALEEEVGMLKGEIKAILQELRVAILARENPFLSNDLDRPGPAANPASLFDISDLPPVPPAAVPAPRTATPVVMAQEAAPQPALEAQPASRSKTDLPAVENSGPLLKTGKRPIDLAALMVWVQESAEGFSHSEFVMLVTMASYADFFDEGLKQALIDMSQQIARDPSEKASLADFSLALKQLESIRATSSRQRDAA
jgi:hypothetical protein